MLIWSIEDGTLEICNLMKKEWFCLTFFKRMWFIYGMLFITTMPKLIIVGQKIKDHFLFTWRPHRPIKKSLNAKLLKRRPCTQIVLITNWCNISIGYNIFYNNILLHIWAQIVWFFLYFLFVFFYTSDQIWNIYSSEKVAANTPIGTRKTITLWTYIHI